MQEGVVQVRRTDCDGLFLAGGRSPPRVLERVEFLSGGEPSSAPGDGGGTEQTKEVAGVERCGWPSGFHSTRADGWPVESHSPPQLMLAQKII